MLSAFQCTPIDYERVHTADEMSKSDPWCESPGLRISAGDMEDNHEVSLTGFFSQVLISS
jgi:hypothetical protein